LNKNYINTTKGTEAQRQRGTEAKKHIYSSTEAQRQRGTEAKKHRSTEAQRHRGKNFEDKFLRNR
jgi:hypothetical protein